MVSIEARRLSASLVLQLRFDNLSVLGLGHFQEMDSLHDAIGMPGKNAEAIGSNAEAAYFSTD